MKMITGFALGLALLAGNGWAQPAVDGPTQANGATVARSADSRSSDTEFQNRIGLVMPLPARYVPVDISDSLEGELDRRMADDFAAEEPRREGLVNARYRVMGPQ